MDDSPTRVVVGSRSSLLRQLLRIGLAKRAIIVVAEAELPSDLAVLATKERPHAVLLVTSGDIPIASVSDLVSSGAPVLVIGDTPSVGTAREALTLGASGFITAQVSLDELAKAVTELRAGGVILDPMVAAVVVKEWASLTTSSPPPSSRPPVLSTREQEILQLLPRGLSTREIAAQLSISEKTVESHKTRLFRALGVRNQGHAVAVALEFGLLDARQR